MKKSRVHLKGNLKRCLATAISVFLIVGMTPTGLTNIIAETASEVVEDEVPIEDDADFSEEIDSDDSFDPESNDSSEGVEEDESNTGDDNSSYPVDNMESQESADEKDSETDLEDIAISEDDVNPSEQSEEPVLGDIPLEETASEEEDEIAAGKTASPISDEPVEESANDEKRNSKEDDAKWFLGKKFVGIDYLEEISFYESDGIVHAHWTGDGFLDWELYVDSSRVNDYNRWNEEWEKGPECFSQLLGWDVCVDNDYGFYGYRAKNILGSSFDARKREDDLWGEVWIINLTYSIGPTYISRKFILVEDNDPNDEILVLKNKNLIGKVGQTIEVSASITTSTSTIEISKAVGNSKIISMNSLTIKTMAVSTGYYHTVSAKIRCLGVGTTTFSFAYQGKTVTGTIQVKPDPTWTRNDEWSFANFTSGGSILTSYQESEILNTITDKAEKERLKSEIKNINKGGVCFGFALSSLLVKQGTLPLKDISNNIETLFDAKKDSSTKSILGFYHLKQKTEYYRNLELEFRRLSDVGKFNLLTRTATPYLLAVAGHETSHAVVVKGIETGNWNYHNHTYDTRLLTYDSEYPNSDNTNEGRYLYLNSETYAWEIPYYYNTGYCSYADGDDNKGMIRSIVSDYQRLSNASWEKLTNTNYAKIFSKVPCSIIKENTSYRITGKDFNDLFFSTTDIGTDPENEDLISSINIQTIALGDIELVPTNDEYFSEETEIDISSGNYFYEMEGVSKGIKTTPDGELRVNNSVGNITATITSDGLISDSSGWTTIIVSGKDIGNFSYECTNEGVNISGDNLSNASVSLSDGETITAKILSNIDAKGIVIYVKDGYICYRKTDSEQPIPVTGITIDQSSMTLTKNETKQLTATVVPSNATEKGVKWSSDNTKVATVSSTGLITAISPGTATITVKTVDGDFSKTCSITVIDKKVNLSECEIKLSNSNYSYDGTEKRPVPTVSYKGKMLSESHDYTISYNNNIDAGIAKITIVGTGDYTGTVDKEYRIEKASYSFSIEPWTTTIGVGMQTYYKIEGGIGRIVFSSNHPEIADIESNGWIEGYSDGVATFTVTSSGDKNHIEIQRTFTIVVSSVYEVDSGSCGDNAKWTYYSDGTVKVSGTGTVKPTRQADGSYLWDRGFKNNYYPKIHTVIIEDGITSIGEYTFTERQYSSSGHMSDSPKNVLIGDTVKSIDRYAFYCCNNLETIEIGSGLSEIGNYAFTYCPSLSKITVSASNKNYVNKNDTLFSKDLTVLYRVLHTGLSEYTIPDGVTTLKRDSFGNLTSLKSIVVPTSVINIEMETFDGSANLRDVYYGGSQSNWSKIIIEDNNQPLENATKHFAIEDISIKDATVSLSASTFVYDGKEKKPLPVVKIGQVTLKQDVDYRVSYSNNINAGTAVLTITGDGDYAGTITVKFKITPADQIMTVTSSDYSLTVGNAALISVKGAEGEISFSSSDTTIATVTSMGEITAEKVGTVKITATASSTANYNSASTDIIINVLPAAIKNATVSLSSSTFVFDGKEKKPVPVVKMESIRLIQGIDYYVHYSDNINAGAATVTITGKGNYSGTISATFKIVKASQSITAKSTATLVAVGKTATVTITGNKGTKSYKSSNAAVATVNSSGKVTAKNVGTVTITAMSGSTSNYNAALKKLTIKVVPAATSSITAANQEKGIKITYKKVTGANGYIIYRNDKKVKTLTSGSIVSWTDTAANTNGTKYVYKVVAKGSTGTSTLSKSLTTYRVAKPTIAALTNSASKKMTIKWGKNAKANGYQVQYSPKKTFKSGNKTVTVTSAGTVSKTIGSLTKGKTYYARIRTYKTVGKKKYYSSWSATKAVKISK